MFRTIKWKKLVDESETFLDGGKLPCILVENKIDLLENPKDGEENLEQFAKDNGFCGWFRTSAKTGYNISESIGFLIKLIIQRMKDMKNKNIEEDFARDTIILKDKSESNKKEKPKKCC